MDELFGTQREKTENLRSLISEYKIDSSAQKIRHLVVLQGLFYVFSKHF